MKKNLLIFCLFSIVGIGVKAQSPALEHHSFYYYEITIEMPGRHALCLFGYSEQDLSKTLNYRNVNKFVKSFYRRTYYTPLILSGGKAYAQFCKQPEEVATAWSQTSLSLAKKMAECPHVVRQMLGKYHVEISSWRITGDFWKSNTPVLHSSLEPPLPMICKYSLGTYVLVSDAEVEATTTGHIVEVDE